MLILILIITIIDLAALIFLLTRKQTIMGDTVALEQARSSADRLEKIVKDEISRNRQELSAADSQSRQEFNTALKAFENSLLARIKENETSQKNQLDTFSNELSKLTKMNELKLEAVRQAVEQKLKLMQDDNALKLEQIRVTVDEKLHSTLEKRLGESFKIVSERLEQVHKGLGEMQNLAIGVGDLKKVLTNVKTRGMWGEIQLGNLLEQILTPEQYGVNVATKKGSADRVEFAIKLPGRDVDGTIVLLPIDAKFPQEDYQRLVEAQEQANMAAVDEAGKALEARIKGEAKDIRDKYLDPPHTTDFGILFLPIESLYAEVVRRPGLLDTLQRDFRVIVTGPTTIAALLNSLQMGFRTLVIEKRSSEVWRLLGVVKTEFSKFGEILDKTKKKLEEAANTIEDASSKTRNIQTRLRNVQELPSSQPADVLESQPQ